MFLSGCVVVARTTETYDPSCQVVTHHVELEARQIAVIGNCRNNAECTGMLVVTGVIAGASAVISGSIAVVGNVVYWMEKQGQCLRPT